MNDAYNAFARQVKRFEVTLLARLSCRYRPGRALDALLNGLVLVLSQVDFNVSDEDSVQHSRRNCKDATLNCCPYIMYR